MSLTPEEIGQNYKKKSLPELQLLLTDLESMRKDVLPILATEFRNRGDIESSQKINDYITGETAEIFTLEDAKVLLDERLSEGFSFEEIKLDLMDKGINIFDIINEESDKENRILDLITEKRKAGESEKNIEAFIDSNFELDENEKERISNRFIKVGKQKIVFGVILLALGLFVFFAKLFLNGFSISGIGAIIIGFGLLMTGINQVKKNNSEINLKQ